MYSNCSNSLDMRKRQEQVKNKKAFCYQNIFWTVTVWINCHSDLKMFCKLSAFSLEFQKFLSITRTIFSYTRSEQFWLPNTNGSWVWTLFFWTTGLVIFPVVMTLWASFLYFIVLCSRGWTLQRKRTNELVLFKWT